jgi:site-specific DNA-methyltransferase (adenine-specific)
MIKTRAPRNRTIVISPTEEARYGDRLLTVAFPVSEKQVENRTIRGDTFTVVDLLPSSFVDLLFLDPSYNITKNYEGNVFRERGHDEYVRWWIESWFPRFLRVLKPDASLYICADWNSSTAVHLVAQKYVAIRNRITWEREKGRGAKQNWKNCSEDIWFCTKGRNYTFNVDAVKLKRRVVAPYRDSNGDPKDWEDTGRGGYRLTHPSNLWTDITVPFWSMPENTDHPTQKPEKLLAKLILASTHPGAMVLDPFLGSGTASVVSKRLGRRFVGIESSILYCMLAEKRLEMAEHDSSIQGYQDGVFWERNSLQDRKRCFASHLSLEDAAANLKRLRCPLTDFPVVTVRSGE